METDSLTVAVPKFMLVPFIRALPWDWLALVTCHIEQPHSVWSSAVLMAEQDQIAILRVDMHVIDPELILAQYFFCLP